MANKKKSFVKSKTNPIGQIMAIRKKEAAKNKDLPLTVVHPDFPFWARLKISKNRPTLVIDEEIRFNKKTNKDEDGFVHREVTHTAKNEFLKVEPNPNKKDKNPMYLKRPSWLPKQLFKPENKLPMPDQLKTLYKK